LAQAKKQGVELVGPGGLLNHPTKRVLEIALEFMQPDRISLQRAVRLGAGPARRLGS